MSAGHVPAPVRDQLPGGDPGDQGVPAAGAGSRRRRPGGHRRQSGRSVELVQVILGWKDRSEACYDLCGGMMDSEI